MSGSGKQQRKTNKRSVVSGPSSTDENRRVERLETDIEEAVASPSMPEQIVYRVETPPPASGSRINFAYYGTDGDVTYPDHTAIDYSRPDGGYLYRIYYRRFDVPQRARYGSTPEGIATSFVSYADAPTLPELGAGIEEYLRWSLYNDLNGAPFQRLTNASTAGVVTTARSGSSLSYSPSTPRALRGSTSSFVLEPGVYWIAVWGESRRSGGSSSGFLSINRVGWVFETGSKAQAAPVDVNTPGGNLNASGWQQDVVSYGDPFTPLIGGFFGFNFVPPATATPVPSSGGPRVALLHRSPVS